MSRAPLPSPLVRRTANGLLDVIGTLTLGDPLPAETELATNLSVSRSPVRAALEILVRRGVLRRDGSRSIVVRQPAARDRFADDDAPVSKGESFERFFLDKLHRGELGAGARFSELELAREFKLTTVTVREGLLRYARFGLIHKEPRHQWRVVEFDERMVDELFDLRELLEQAALAKALALPADHPLRAELADILAEHRRFAAGRAKPVDRFLALDDRLHRTLFQAAANRYLDGMYAMVSLLIHFQLRRDDPVGARGMDLGLAQHPPLLEAILANDGPRARAEMSTHLASSRMIMKLAAARERDTEH